MIKLIISILKFNTRLDFNKPLHKDILLYDNISSFLSVYLKENSFEILYTRSEKLNLYILFKSFFLFKSEKFSTKYILTFIKYLNPKIIITFNHNKISFYKIKRHFSKIKIISIQNGITSFSSNRSFELNIRDNKEKLLNMNLECDYFFVINKRSEIMFSKFIKANYIRSGSFKSNMCIINKLNKFNKNINYISQYSDDKSNLKNNFNKIEEIVVRNLVNFCEKFNIKCQIYLRRGDKKEKNYFLSIIKNKSQFCDFIFISSKENEKKFSHLDQAELTVFSDTSLGYEMASRNKKVCIISARDQFLTSDECRRLHYGVDEEVFENEGIFWLNRFKNESEVFKKIENVYKLSLDKIINSYYENKDNLFFVDNENSKFKKIVNEQI